MMQACEFVPFWYKAQQHLQITTEEHYVTQVSLQLKVFCLVVRAISE